jgi:hypothetical protein
MKCCRVGCKNKAVRGSNYCSIHKIVNSPDIIRRRNACNKSFTGSKKSAARGASKKVSKKTLTKKHSSAAKRSR